MTPPSSPTLAAAHSGGSGSATVGILRDAALMAGIASALALAVNAVRADGLPLVATEEIETLVPCPEPTGDAEGIAPNDPRIGAATTLLVDARSAADFATWHAPGAVSHPLDWLAEDDEVARQAAAVASEIARSRRRDVVVYGDGDDPDSGEHWAGLLAGAGIKHVVFVRGGAAVLIAPAAASSPPAASSGGDR